MELGNRRNKPFHLFKPICSHYTYEEFVDVSDPPTHPPKECYDDFVREKHQMEANCAKMIRPRYSLKKLTIVTKSFFFQVKDTVYIYSVTRLSIKV